MSTLQYVTAGESAAAGTTTAPATPATDAVMTTRPAPNTPIKP
jgi:hypothetical protein